MPRYATEAPLRGEVRARRSRCAAEARAREQQRVRQLSVEARIDAALSMDGRYAWLKPAAIKE